ncbi:MAG: flagellar hook-basal body complex protein FliE [Gammaproteobacteria bacterium]
MSDINVNDLLAQMRALAAQAQGSSSTPSAVENSEGGFAQLLKSSIDQVNDAQQNARRLAEAFEMGDQQVDLAEVMVQMQKASLSFQAMTQVRNKLVSAYQDIMNMQV